MTDKTETSEPGLLPLVIGVVGRCSSQGYDDPVKQQTQYILQTGVKELYPNTPLILLSTLAEGANRLVVDEALKCGIELIVPLPLPRPDYESDFGDLDQFNLRLEKKAARWFEMDLVPGFTRETIADKNGEHRNLQYALADAYIARYCQILIALRDSREQPTDQRVTVEHIIEFKLNGRFERDGTLELDERLQRYLDNVPEPYWLRRSALYPPDNGPVNVITIPAISGSQPAVLFPQEFKDDVRRGEEFYARIHTHVDRLNAHARQIDANPKLVEYRDKSKGYLLTDDEAAGLSGALRNMRACYHTADILAMQFQSKTNWTLLCLCALALIAAGSFIAYAHLLAHEAAPWPLAIYFLAVAIAFRYYVNAQRLDYQNKYQDYRAIAEGLRVQFFWRLAGLDGSAAEYYLLKQTSELDWIRNVIAACGIRAAPAGRDRMPLVVQRWIENQGNYFAEKARSNRKELLIHRYVGDGFLLVSLLVAIYVLMAYLKEKFAQSFTEPLNSLTEILSEVIAVLIAVVLLFFLYSLIQQIREQYKNLRNEGLPEDEISSASISGEGDDNPLDQFKKQIAKLTEKPASNVVLGIVGGLLLAALVLKVPHLIAFWPRLALKLDEHELLIAAIGLSAVVGGLLHYYAEKRALAEHAKQYGRMTIIFKNAAGRFNKFQYPADYARAAALVKELGIEALAENGDWVLLHRERPVEPIRSMEG